MKTFSYLTALGAFPIPLDDFCCDTLPLRRASKQTLGAGIITRSATRVSERFEHPTDGAA